MVTVPNGTSLLAAGLDHWFEREGGEEDSRDFDLSEFRVEEWRLERLLHVNHFWEPPDFRFPRLGERIPTPVSAFRSSGSPCGTSAGDVTG